MGIRRRVLTGAFKKLEQLADRVDGDALAKLSPAERERYDAWVEHTAAAQAGNAVGDPRLVGAILHGPAGEVLHGIANAPEAAPELEDPGAWEAQRSAELAARDAARAPYLAPGRSAVRFTRVATERRTQVQDVAHQLSASGLAGRPDLVYGVYRVPDLISPSRLGDETYVEWDVVHAADGPLPPAAGPTVLSLPADEVLVARAVGEPAPLDEDLALHFLAGSGIGPESTLGIARHLANEHRAESDAASRLLVRVTGVHILTTAPLTATGAPLRLPEGPPEGTCLDVLQWDAIAQAVHPVRQQRAPLPSPFPYLPLTPQELLAAYLEIVGVAPADAYCAQVTHDREFDLMGRTSTSAHVRRTGGGPDLPCADGKPRKRMAGGHHIVVAYRDRPEYAEGRERFDAYVQTELKAHLRRKLGLRAPLPKPTGQLMRTVDRVADMVDFFSGGTGAEEGFVPPRYCWPPSVTAD